MITRRLLWAAVAAATVAATTAAVAIAVASDNAESRLTARAPVSVGSSYAAFRRAEAASDRGVPHLPSDADVRKVGGGNFLFRRGGELCVTGASSSGAVGAVGCTLEVTASHRPPVTILRTADGVEAIGAAPDDLTAVEFTTGSGESVRAEPTNNGFRVKLPGRFTGGRMVFADGSSEEL